MLIEFYTGYVLTELHLSQYFFEDLRPLIKQWLNKKGLEDQAWDDLFKKAIRIESKAKILKDQDLD